MKIIKFVLAILLLSFISPATSSKAATTNSKKEDTEKVKVYYFHNTRRCATCNAVENVTKEALKENFSDEMDNGTLTFQSVNLEEDEGEKIAEENGVASQALLFVAGEKKVDLTSAGFMNARTKPEKLKQKVKDTVEGLL